MDQMVDPFPLYWFTMTIFHWRLFPTPQNPLDQTCTWSRHAVDMTQIYLFNSIFKDTLYFHNNFQECSGRFCTNTKKFTIKSWWISWNLAIFLKILANHACHWDIQICELNVHWNNKEIAKFREIDHYNLRHLSLYIVPSIAVFITELNLQRIWDLNFRKQYLQKIKKRISFKQGIRHLNLIIAQADYAKSISRMLVYFKKSVGFAF